MNCKRVTAQHYSCPLKGQVLAHAQPKEGQLLSELVPIAGLKRPLHIRGELHKLLLQLGLALGRLRGDELLLVVVKRLLARQQQTQNGSSHRPMVRMSGEQQRVKQSGDQLVTDGRLRGEVLLDASHGGLSSPLVEEYVRVDVVDGSSA